MPINSKGEIVRQDLVDDLLTEIQWGHQFGICANPHRVADRLITTSPVGSWAQLALHLSLNQPGQFWVGSTGLCHVVSRHLCWISEPDMVAPIQDARKIATYLTKDENIGYSCASASRACLRWTGLSQPWRTMDHLQAHALWAYQYCEPKHLPQGYLHDITSCYYSLMCRAPSPYVQILDGELDFPEPEQKEFSKWKDMLSAIGQHKSMRNSLVGQMYSAGLGTYYYGGKSNAPATPQEEGSRNRKAPPGLLRPLASMVIRAGYELCCLAREEEKGFYANTDCVISSSPLSPPVWNKYGMRVKLKASGPSDICAVGYYRVGKFETEWWKKEEASAKEEGRRPSHPKLRARPEKEAVQLVLNGDLLIDRWLT